jgi:hypothetical protein
MMSDVKCRFFVFRSTFLNRVKSLTMTSEFFLQATVSSCACETTFEVCNATEN